MKLCFAISCALILSVANVSADPLPAGKPAGLHQAQLEGGNAMLVAAGAALVGIGIGLATATGDNAQPITATSSTTTSSTAGTSP